MCVLCAELLWGVLCACYAACRLRHRRRAAPRGLRVDACCNNNNNSTNTHKRHANPLYWRACLRGLGGFACRLCVLVLLLRGLGGFACRLCVLAAIPIRRRSQDGGAAALREID